MINRLFATAAIALLCFSSAACTQDGDCEKTVDHIMELIQRDLPEQQRAKLDLAQERTTLVQQCSKHELTKQQEECVLRAKSLPDLNKCDRR